MALPKVALFSDINYGGRVLNLDTNVPDLRDYDFNDITSSVWIKPGYFLKVYEHTNFGGVMEAFSTNIADLRGTTIGNDRISSLEIGIGEAPPAPPPAPPSIIEQIITPIFTPQQITTPIAQVLFSPIFSPLFEPHFAQTFSPVLQNVFSPENIFSPLIAFDPIVNILGSLTGGFITGFATKIGEAFPIGEQVKIAVSQAKTVEAETIHSSPEFLSLVPWNMELIRTVSMMGALVGSPLGFLPFIGDLYKGGLGEEVMKAGRAQFVPTLLPEDLYLRAWLRGEATEEWIDGEFKLSGYRDDRRDIIKKLAYIVPPLADMVRFADYSAFDPAVIEAWREFYDAPDWIREPFSMIGVTGDWADKYWFSHWRQPGRFELEDMFWRRIIDEDGVRLAYRTQGFSEFWQDALIAKIYNPFTRVDVRRMWDIGVLNDDETVLAYQDIGYSPDNARKFLIFTKLFQRLPDLRSRFKKGWITEDELLTELIDIGLAPDRAEWELETLIKADKGDRVERERDLTKAEIYKGVKKEIITWEQGIWLLLDLGYDEWEAGYILAINVGVLAGSPDTFYAFKNLTQRWRQSQKRPSKVPPQELIHAEDQVKALEDSLQEAEKEEAPEAEVNLLKVGLAEARFKFEHLRSLYEAE